MPGKASPLLAVAASALVLAGAAPSRAQSLRYEVLHAFDGASGQAPYSALALGGGGRLYGTTSAGGTFGLGTLFRYDPSDATFSTVHHFDGAGGARPLAGVILSTDGSLYGTTFAGGANGAGTLFRYDPQGPSFSSIHHMTNEGSAQPLLEGPDGMLYGTTGIGGDSSPVHGTLFRYDRTTSTLETMHLFPSPTDEAASALVMGPDGALYATTIDSLERGALIRCEPGPWPAAVDELFPLPYSVAAPLFATDGSIYGTTVDFGPGDDGTVFRFNLAPPTLTFVHDFTPSRGVLPASALVQATDGGLYGTTFRGGFADKGTVYRFDPVTLKHTMLHSFTGADGANPVAALLPGGDGWLYGTTRAGGRSGAGVLFRLRQSPIR